MSATDYGWLILAFPLVGTVAIALGWRLLPGRSAGVLGSLTILGSFLASLGALSKVDGEAHEASAFSYAKTVGLNVDLGILIDPLSVFMALVVSGVSFLIHVYSFSYMASDRGYARFFAYLNFFVF